MIRLKTKDEIKILREGGKKLAGILSELSKKVAPGVTGQELDDLAFELIKKAGGKPSFLNYKPAGVSEPYPASLCVSFNEEIVHGIPGKRAIKEGDIISLDLGMWYQGLCTDHAVTIAVGEVDEKVKKLIEATRDALRDAIRAVAPGARMGDVSYAIESLAASRGYEVVRELSGHGVGNEVHEDPFVPNYGKPGTGLKLVKGMVLAIEPMLSLGTGEVKGLSDGYTFITRDKSLSAHFEHTVAVTEDGAEILTRL